MGLPIVGEQYLPTPKEVLNQCLADLRFGYDRLGVTVNVLPGGEHYQVAKAFAGRVAIAVANGELAQTAMNPLTAVYDDLVPLAAVFGVFPRPASQASGAVICSVTNGPTAIPAGFKWSSPVGNTYELTTTHSTVNDTDTVEIISLGTGLAQNVDAGQIGKWVSGSIGALGASATVALGDIDGGRDADDVETLRRRLLTRLSLPQVGGNSAQVAAIAEAATAAVQRAFVYSVRGPGSYDVAVTTDSGDRALSPANLSIVNAALVENMPGHASLNLTSISRRRAIVVAQLSLSLPVNAGGAGGGWLDAAPWPSTNETSATVLAEVTAVDLNSNALTVNSTSLDPPTAGKRFAIWDADKSNGLDDDGVERPLGGFVQFAASTVTGSSGAYVIAIDASSSGSLAFVALALTITGLYGAFCSPAAVRIDEYGEIVRESVALLGPGEKTTNVDILPRGRRQPTTGAEFPANLTALQLSGLTDRDDETKLPNFEEVLDVSYVNRVLAGTTAIGTAAYTALSSPGVPPTTADPPRIITLQSLSFRAQLD